MKEAWLIMLIGGVMFSLLLLTVVFLYVRRFYNTRTGTKLPQMNGTYLPTIFI